MWACAHPQREGRASPRQVSTALPASQVPSQALGDIFLSSPPTASCFPPQSLHLPGPSPGQLAASQKTFQSGAQSTDRNTEAHQFLRGRLLVSGHISALAAQHSTSRHASLSQEVSTLARLPPTPPVYLYFEKVRSHCQLIHSFTRLAKQPSSLPHIRTKPG